MDVDKDNDGLIEICDLEGLNEMRYALDGSGYRAAADAMIIADGCPSTSCTGFELTRDLDFNDPDSYRSRRSINSAWTSGDGWQPIAIGDSLSNAFSAIFNGNGYTISNLMINRSGQNNIGLFGLSTMGEIANLGLLNVDIIGFDRVGSLVGNNLGAITNSYATGSVSGTAGVGGLVGQNFAFRDFSGSITNSYATASVSSTGTSSTNIGGLAGANGTGTLRASIRNSYATGEVTGSGTATRVGGLVGWNLSSSSIANSYATGEVRGSGDSVGGLTGTNGGTIENSYWLDRPGLSRGSGVSAGTSRTAMQLTSPTTPTTMVYTDWLTSDWDFGSSLQYPILKYADDNLMGSLIVTGDLIPGQGVGLRSLQPLTDGAEFITTSGEATAFSEATTRHTIAVPPGTSEIGLTLTAYNSDDNSNTTIDGCQRRRGRRPFCWHGRSWHCLRSDSHKPSANHHRYRT